LFVRVRRLSAAVSLLTACLIGFAADAQTFNKSMVAGGALKLGHYASVNPDCTSKGKTVVRLSVAPTHGTIRLREGKDFSFFNSPLQQPCNTRRVEGVTVEYRPEHGFIGSDTVGVNAIYPSGNERTETFYITVK